MPSPVSREEASMIRSWIWARARSRPSEATTRTTDRLPLCHTLDDPRRYPRLVSQPAAVYTAPLGPFATTSHTRLKLFACFLFSEYTSVPSLPPASIVLATVNSHPSQICPLTIIAVLSNVLAVHCLFATRAIPYIHPFIIHCFHHRNIHCPFTIPSIHIPFLMS